VVHGTNGLRLYRGRFVATGGWLVVASGVGLVGFLAWTFSVAHSPVRRPPMENLGAGALSFGVALAIVAVGLRTVRSVGVLLSPAGVSIRYVLNRSTHISWEEFDSFAYVDRFPFFTWARTTSGHAIGITALAALTRAVGPRLHDRSARRIERIVAEMNREARRWRRAEADFDEEDGPVVAEG
jgi:hypothetical protein